MALAPVRVAPPRVKFSTDHLVDAAMNSPRWAHLLNAAANSGMNARKVQQLLRLWLTKSRVNGESSEIASKHLLRLLQDCGLSHGDAKRIICQRLCGVRDNPQLNLHQTNNEYFRVDTGGRLDLTGPHLKPHLCKVFIKSHGINEIMQNGNHALNVHIRALASEMMNMVNQQIERARSYEQNHKREELRRRIENRNLKDNIQGLILCNEQSAQGYYRSFRKKLYDALGIINRNDPNFRTAKAALRTVATDAQLNRRSSQDVSDNLTISGKYADFYVSNMVSNDLARPQLLAEMDATNCNRAKKRLLNTALTTRVTRMKRFNFFHVDPNMVGMDNEQGLVPIDANDQANCYLNQEAEMLSAF